MPGGWDRVISRDEEFERFAGVRCSIFYRLGDLRIYDDGRVVMEVDGTALAFPSPAKEIVEMIYIRGVLRDVV